MDGETVLHYRDGKGELTLRRGEVYGLVGAPGSGKTALLRVLTGLTPPEAGAELALFGAREGKALEQARASVGALVGEPCCYGDLSLGRNLRALCISLGKRHDPGVRALLHAFNLSAARLGNRSMKHATTEQKLVFGIVAALLNAPSLLLLDEPLKGIDPAARSALSEELETRCRTGMTALLTEESLPLLYALPQVRHFLLWKDGRAVAVLEREVLAARVEAQGEDVDWAEIEREAEGDDRHDAGE